MPTRRNWKNIAVDVGPLVAIFAGGILVGRAFFSAKPKSKSRPPIQFKPAPVYTEKNEKFAFTFAAQRVMIADAHRRYEDDNRWRYEEEKGFPDKEVDLEFYQIAYLAGRDMSR